MKNLLWIILLLSSCSTTKVLTTSQIENQKIEIRAAMNSQQEAWNRGDIEGYMQGYWQDDRLMFTGSRGISYGWNKVLANYKKGYPDKSTMGTLKFEIKELNPLSGDTYHMIGVYTLYREADEPTGYFTLLWKLVEGKWVVISDHTG